MVRVKRDPDRRSRDDPPRSRRRMPPEVAHTGREVAASWSTRTRGAAGTKWMTPSLRPRSAGRRLLRGAGAAVHRAYSSSGRFLARERISVERPTSVLRWRPATARASRAAVRAATASGLKRTSKGLRTGLRPVRASPFWVHRIAGDGASGEGLPGCSRSRSGKTGLGASAVSTSSRGADDNWAATMLAASVHETTLTEKGRICRVPGENRVTQVVNRWESYAGCRSSARTF